MLVECSNFFDVTAEPSIKDRLKEMNEIESNLRQYFCIEDCEDTVEVVLQVLLDLNLKHVDRVDKLTKMRQSKLQQRKERVRSPKVSERKSNYFIKQPTTNLKYPKSQRTTPKTSPV